MVGVRRRQPRPVPTERLGAAVERSSVTITVEAAGERLWLGVVLFCPKLLAPLGYARVLVGGRVLAGEQATQEHRTDADGQKRADDRACTRLRGPRRSTERIAVR